MMADAYTAITKQDGDWWIGWIEEVPGVNCQERTREELLASLENTLREVLWEKWDREIEADSESGKLDFLLREAAEANTTICGGTNRTTALG
jgi:predicted RNase H-like HicB family nuclease